MKNYYELFRYKAVNGSYSDVDLSNLIVRYDLMTGKVDTELKNARPGSSKYAKLVDLKEQLKKAYEVLSDASKRAQYDATLKPSKGATARRKAISLVASFVIATTALGATAARAVGESAPAIVTEQTNEDAIKVRTDVVEMGDVEDDAYVMAMAEDQAARLAAANVVNPVTASRYTAEEIFRLIKYSNGVYVPETVEEIDILHLDLLNLFISPINVDGYLYHVLFASGDDGAKELLDPKLVHVGFADAFTAYGKNGVYPLVKWFEQKRFDIYSATDRTEINAIYREVGQVMADLMKGNGATITWEGKTYTFTSEQVLANHSSAMLITVEFQLIMANHYEKRNGKEIDAVSQEWEVYNKFNIDGVDEEGKPIIKPDIVTYDEMNAWVNNGCDYEWGIADVLVDGQTFGQRIQGDMEGMALNNYQMVHGNGSLTN